LARPAAGAMSSNSHQIHEYLCLAAALGADAAPIAPYLHVSAAETAEAQQKFGLAALGDPGPLFGINPGAEYGPAKRWPIERFIAVAIELQRRTHCRWSIFGGASDVAIAQEIAVGINRAQPQDSHCTVVNLAGKTTLRELSAALKLCRVLLTNDSGPMHIAAAVGTPVVVPFGSTSAALTGPGLPSDSRHQLLSAKAACSPCFRRTCPIDFRCMTGISVEDVVAAVLHAAAKPPTAPSPRSGGSLRSEAL
jgi:heptosyltransferase II